METEEELSEPEFDPISSRLNETFPFSADELIAVLAAEQIRQEFHRV